MYRIEKNKKKIGEMDKAKKIEATCISARKSEPQDGQRRN